MTRIMQLTSYGALNAALALYLHQRQPSASFGSTMATSCFVSLIVAALAVFVWYLVCGPRAKYKVIEIPHGDYRVMRYHLGDHEIVSKSFSDRSAAEANARERNRFDGPGFG